MSLFERIERLERKINQLFEPFPEWIPVSTHFAKQYGYTIDGFRNYCLTNINPTYFKKFGKQYHIHKTALPQLKRK